MYSAPSLLSIDRDVKAATFVSFVVVFFAVARPDVAPGKPGIAFAGHGVAVEEPGGTSGFLDIDPGGGHVAPGRFAQPVAPRMLDNPSGVVLTSVQAARRETLLWVQNVYT